jgi:hypothetical protein
MVGREDYQAGQKSCNEGTKELNTKNTGGQDVFLIERKVKDEEADRFFLCFLVILCRIKFHFLHSFHWNFENGMLIFYR